MPTRRYLRRGRRFAVSMVAVCATLAATASVALATSSYSAVITPVSAAAGATADFNVALTNNTASNGINSAMITPPKKFSLVGASSPQGTTQVQPNKVIIRDLNLPLGATVTVRLEYSARGVLALLDRFTVRGRLDHALRDSVRAIEMRFA